jgi:hypothetical protein
MRRNSAGFALRFALGIVAVVLVGCQSSQVLDTSTNPAGATAAAATTHSGKPQRPARHGSALPAPTAGATAAPATSSSNLGFAPITSGLKPLIRGLIYLQGAPPASVRLSMAGYDIQGRGGDYGAVSWAELQPTASGPIVPDNPIDLAIAEVRSWNAAHPMDHQMLLLRVLAGVHSPAWALNLGGPCVAVTDPVFTLHGCTPRFWTAPYSRAFYRFEAALAAKYDTVPEISEVVIARNMTFYNEPMLRQISDPSSVAHLKAAGYTTSLDEQNQRADMVDLGKYWKHTLVGYTFNPYQSLDPVANTEVFTAQLMAYGRHVLGAQLVLDNDSARVSFITQPGYFSQMYASMQQLGTPLGFQTAVLRKVGNLLTTIQGLIGLGANNVELPPGFETVLTQEQLAALSSALIMN